MPGKFYCCGVVCNDFHKVVKVCFFPEKHHACHTSILFFGEWVSIEVMCVGGWVGVGGCWGAGVLVCVGALVFGGWWCVATSLT